MAKYPYVILPGQVCKPWIQVRLGYKKTHKVTPSPIFAVIDSGADVCFCERNIGLWLGAKLSKGEKKIFTTANRGKFEATKENLTLYACGKNYECPFYLTDGLPRETPIILGQLGFFDHFKITFDLKNKEMDIE